jgi:diadenosine tetraphosphate (Ap4A) HIT family hydrolase
VRGRSARRRDRTSRALVVEHTVGSLGVGTLIVKSARHVVSVAELTSGEAAELGPIVRRTAHVVRELTQPSQVYVCLWSHLHREPGTSTSSCSR